MHLQYYCGKSKLIHEVTSISKLHKLIKMDIMGLESRVYNVETESICSVMEIPGVSEEIQSLNLEESMSNEESMSKEESMSMEETVSPLGFEKKQIVLEKAPKENNKSKVLSPWIILLISSLLFLGTEFLDIRILLMSQSAIYSIRDILGLLASFFVIGLCIVLLIYRVKSKKRRARILIVFAIIWGAIQVLSFTNAVFKTMKVSRQNEAAISTLYGFMDDFIQKKTPIKKIFDENTYGENAVFLNLIMIISFDIMTIQNNLEKVIDEISQKDINTLFNDKEEFSNTQLQIKDCITKFQELYKKRELFRKDFKNMINGMNISDNEKMEIIESSENSHKEYDTIYKEYIDNEIVLFTIRYKQLEYLKINQNTKFKIENKKLIFYDNKDMSDYNVLIKEIQVSVKREEELTTIITDLREENLKRLEKLK